MLGCQRSGKTLLGAILNKHPDLFILFETTIFSDLYRKWLYRQRIYNDSPEELFVALISNTWHNKKSGISFQDIVDCARKGTPDWSRMLDSYMRFLAARAKPGALRWGDKTPSHLANITEIQKQYPDAQFIYIYRDPRDVIASLSETSYPQAANDYLINAEVVRQYLFIYREEKRKARREAILEIQYENLVRNPKEVVKNICDFLDVGYKPELLEEASPDIRRMIGWPNSKAWGRILPQVVRLPGNVADFVEAYMGDWICDSGYKKRNIRFPGIRRLLVLFRLIIFRGTKYLLSLCWNKLYPGFPFIMKQYPSLTNVIRWLGYFGARKKDATTYRKARARLRAILKRYDFRGKSALDLGCNGGYFSFKLAGYAKGILAIDKDEKYIRENRKKNQLLGISNIRFEIGIISPAFVESLEEVDVTLFLSVLHHTISASGVYTNAEPGQCGMDYGLQILKAICAKTHILFFEMGQSNESAEWRAGLPDMGSAPEKWIVENLLKPAGFRDAITIEPPEWLGIGGFIRKFIYRKMEPFVIGNAIIGRVVRRALCYDTRDCRYIFMARGRL